MSKRSRLKPEEKDRVAVAMNALNQITSHVGSARENVRVWKTGTSRGDAARQMAGQELEAALNWAASALAAIDPTRAKRMGKEIMREVHEIEDEERPKNGDEGDVA